MKLLLCTLNKNKIKEISEVLKNTPINIITLFDLKDNEDVVEDGLTIEANALIKAKHYGDKHQMLAIADDTALEVDYLAGGPGVHTKRYEKTDELRNKKLIRELANTSNKKARFRTVVCLYNPKNKKEYYFEGIVNGLIVDEPRGNYGFGYDPIFYIKEKDKTMAELTVEEKNEISHRGKAIKLFGEFINENINNIWYP